MERITTGALFCLWATAANGNPTGGAFSGPAQPSGASVYWNPAALAATDNVPAVFAEVTGDLVHLRYQRTPGDPQDNTVYPPVSFTTPAPDPSLMASVPLPWPWLRLIFGAESIGSGGSRWPDDGPQRYQAASSQTIGVTAMPGLLFTPWPGFAIGFVAGPMYLSVEGKTAVDFGAILNSQFPNGAGPFGLENPDMQGWLSTKMSGWSLNAAWGLWAQPYEWLTLGLGLTTPRAVPLHGSLNVTAPPALAKVAPGYQLNPHAIVDVSSAIPGTLNAEAQVHSIVDVAAMVQFAQRSVWKVMVARVSNAEPQILNGNELTLRTNNDHWTFGLRISGAVTPNCEAAVRFDYYPSAVPTSALTASNFDFTIYEPSVAVRWTTSSKQTFTITYAFGYFVTVNETDSIYSPNATTNSGLSQPSANGVYGGWIQRLTLGVNFFM